MLRDETNLPATRHHTWAPWLVLVLVVLFLASPVLPILAGYDPLQENFYLLHAAFFFALLTLVTTLASVVPRLFRARWWIAIPIGAILLDFTISFEPLAVSQPLIGIFLTLLTIFAVLLLRRTFPHWSWLGRLLFATSSLAATAYLLYVSFVTYAFFHGSLYLVASSLLLFLEFAALTISISFLFEIIDALAAPLPVLPDFDPTYQPLVAIQVPAYNEPLSVMRATLQALAALDYPNFLVQVVDNNTPDPQAVKALQAFTATLGERFQFIHLENWPGYKAGALNEATKRLGREVEILAIVDADYVVAPNWLRASVGYFANSQVAFVQSPQDYRDWGDNLYLRGLYYSYRYFFAVSMISRARRNAIIFAGTMGLIRRSSFEAIGGWNQDVITEDSEASLRLLALGYQGVYVPRAFGRGLMPLTFTGLKQQRFRWALGGVQILRLHTRRLLFPRLEDKLTLGQRLHYLFGNLQWFNELLFLLFTLLLIATAISSAFHHVLPIRQLAPLLLGLPLAFLFAGLFRALWAMRTATHASLTDAVNAMRVWFALSFVVSLALLRGLVRFRTAFLRTPKFKVGSASWLQLFRAGALESLLALTALTATAAMLILAPSTATFALAILLLFQTIVFGSASWAARAAETVTLTPFRRTYMASAQSTGSRPAVATTLVSTPVLAGFAVVGLVVLAALFTPPPSPATSLPPAIPVALPSPIPSPSPHASPSPSPSISPSPSPSPLTSPSPSPSPLPSPVPSPSPSPVSSPVASPT